MNVKIGKYIIKSDSACFTLYETSIGQSGKSEGIEKESVIGYYIDFNQALMGLSRQMLLESEATTLDQVLVELSKIKDIINVYRISNGEKGQAKIQLDSTKTS